MRTQLSIQQLPLTKRNDPWSSDAAGESFHRSGRMGTQRRRVLQALRRYGPCTSAELAAAMSNIDRYGPHRRLAEIERMGLAERAGFRVCKVTKQKCQIWKATTIDHDLFGNEIRKEQ